MWYNVSIFSLSRRRLRGAEITDRLVATARFARRFGAGLRDLTFDLAEGFDADLPERLEAALDFFSADFGLARDLTLALFEVLARRRDTIALIIPAEEVLSRGNAWSN
jgi:hypothetical protein